MNAIGKALILQSNSIAEAGPIIANNAKCVQTAITAMYFSAFGTSFYGMIGSIFAVVALLF